jgi:hypothetical protein
VLAHVGGNVVKRATIVCLQFRVVSGNSRSVRSPQEPPQQIQTVIRSPRTHGCPDGFSGSIVIRAVMSENTTGLKGQQFVGGEHRLEARSLLTNR